MNSKSMALLAKEALEEKQGGDPIVLDIRKLTQVADYFVIVHGHSERHVHTLADVVLEWLLEKGIKALHVEGMREQKWVLLDYGSVIVHVFYRDIRSFYSLERLWGEAKQVSARKKLPSTGHASQKKGIRRRG